MFILFCIVVFVLRVERKLGQLLNNSAQGTDLTGCLSPGPQFT